MADSGVFATTAEVQRKTGANANATANTEAYINDYISQAESYINSVCRYNFSDNYASLNIDVKAILKEVASNLAAISVISYDMGEYTSRAEAQTMLDVLYQRVQDGIKELKEKQTQNFINNA